MTFNLFDLVELLHDSIKVPAIRAGAKGYVVEVFEPDGLMVEFLDEARPGYTIDVLDLLAQDVKLVRRHVSSE